jgi:hypothetical protein
MMSRKAIKRVFIWKENKKGESEGSKSFFFLGGVAGVDRKPE